MTAKLECRKPQRGVTLLGLLMWAILIGAVALLAMKVFPTVNEFLTIQKTINQIAVEGASTVPEVRSAFEKRKSVEYSISSISGSDLEVTKENEKVVISFAYDKEIELFSPVYLLIKYQGKSQ